MSDDKQGYVAFLEASVPVDESGIGSATPQELSEAAVDDTYKGMQSDVVGWDGKKGFPGIAKDAKLNDVVDKILKRSPKEDGTKQAVDLNKTSDPSGIKDGKHVTESEDGDGDEDDKEDGEAADHVEPDGDEKEVKEESTDETDDDEDDEDCPECEKKIQEIYQSLGISPLQMLEDEDDSLQDLVGEEDLPDEDFELSEEENVILASLISEMGIVDGELPTEELDEDENLLDELDIELED